LEREESQHDLGLMPRQPIEAGLDPGGDPLDGDAVDQIVADVRHQSEGTKGRALVQCPPETAAGDPRQPAGEEEAAPGSVRAPMPAGGQHLDGSRGRPADAVDDDRQASPEVAGAEEDGSQDGLAVGHPCSLPRAAV
jgi:hypothetical protein